MEFIKFRDSLLRVSEIFYARVEEAKDTYGVYKGHNVNVETSNANRVISFLYETEEQALDGLDELYSLLNIPYGSVVIDVTPGSGGTGGTTTIGDPILPSNT